MMNSKLRMTDKEAEELLRGKSVSLVGRAASLLEKGDGKRIDESDFVIRVNWALPHDNPAERVGSRTDILLHTQPAQQVKRMAWKAGVRTWAKNDDVWQHWVSKGWFPKKTLPRTGTVAVQMLLNSGVEEIYLSGFDFGNSGSATATYMSKQDRNWGYSIEDLKGRKDFRVYKGGKFLPHDFYRHNTNADKEFIERLLGKTNKLKLDRVLLGMFGEQNAAKKKEK